MNVDAQGHAGRPHAHTHSLGRGGAERVEFLNGVVIQGLCVCLSVGQCQFEVHHFVVGLGQLKHHLSADH